MYNKYFAAIYCMITLILLAGAGCESASRAPLPIPIQEAAEINGNIMSIVQDEVEEARSLGYLRPGAAYTNSASTVVITGSYVPTASKNTTHATVQMLSLSFQASTNTYWITGTINYNDISHGNGERTTKYSSSGNFTLSKGLESWECRWPLLEKVITLDSDTGEFVARPLQGSYAIDGVTYSYPRNRM